MDALRGRVPGLLSVWPSRLLSGAISSGAAAFGGWRLARDVPGDRGGEAERRGAACRRGPRCRVAFSGWCRARAGWRQRAIARIYAVQLGGRLASSGASDKVTGSRIMTRFGTPRARRRDTDWGLV